MEEYDHPGETETEKSKSQVKREMHALQDLGKELVQLPEEQFNKLDLDDDLSKAILEARRISKHGAYKRQLKYIGRLLRNLDTGDIQSQLDTIQGNSTRAVQIQHRVERWRDSLIVDGDNALELFINEFPAADRQLIRQLIRNAQKEQQQNKPPASSRKLFRYIRELLEA